MPSRNGDPLFPGSALIFRRRSFLPALASLALLLLVAAREPALAAERVVYQDSLVEMTSADAIPRDVCRTAAERIREAWEFDLREMRWQNPGIGRKKIVVRLIAPEKLTADHHGLRAVTAPDGIHIKLRSDLLETEGGRYRTVPHELGHVQAFRALGKRSTPFYFMEGHGLILGHLFAEAHGKLKDGNVENTKTLRKLGPEEVRTILTDNSYSNGEKDADRTFKMECMGLFFVEYLRARHGGRGIPDMVPKMGQVFDRVGRGEKYPDAFRKVYGFSVDKAVDELVDLFKQTKDDPDRRFEGL
jgi:hypothetical protein